MQSDSRLRTSAGGLVLGVAMLMSGCIGDGSVPAPSAGPVVNVADFGAVGNGTVDDRPSIQAALDHASLSGATVYFPAGTFRLRTASLHQDRILVTYPDQVLAGAGQDLSRLVVGTSFGPYVAVIGAASDQTGTSSWSMQDLGVDQNARSNNALDSDLMHQYPKMAVRLGDYRAGSRVTVERSRFQDSDSMNTLYLFAATITVDRNSFVGIGGRPGMKPHDHSTLYSTTTEDGGAVRISGNTFTGVRSAGGAATAIETHGGQQLVVDNVATDYLRGFNITGIATARTTAVRVSGNVVNRAAIGVQLWSEGSSTSEGGGLTDVELVENYISLDGSSWQSTGLQLPTAGVLLTPSNTAPVLGLSITRNQIRYVWANPSSAVAPYTAAISCRVNEVSGQSRNVTISDNLIADAPTAIDETCIVDGAIVKGNRILG